MGQQLTSARGQGLEAVVAVAQHLMISGAPKAQVVIAIKNFCSPAEQQAISNASKPGVGAAVAAGKKAQAGHAAQTGQANASPAPSNTPASAHTQVARQAMPGRDDNNVASDADEHVHRAHASAGAPLPPELQQRFESSLGVDLGGVRVHTGDASATAAEAVGAHAYTMGKDIHFATGAYSPGSPAGQKLLAHEVAHTVQQDGTAQRAQYKLAVSAVQDSSEVEADRAADAMVAGRSFAVNNAPRRIHRFGTPPKNRDKDASHDIDRLASNYQDLMTKQLDGLDNLQHDMSITDPPTLKDELIKAAVVAVVAGAAALLLDGVGGMILAGVATSVDSAVEEDVSVLEKQVLTETQNSGEERDAAIQALKLAGENSKNMADTVKSTICDTLKDAAKSGVQSAAATVSGAQEPFRIFFETARTGIENTAHKSKEAAFSGASQLNMPYGDAAASTMADNVESALGLASAKTYAGLVSKWAEISSGGYGGALSVHVTLNGTQVAITGATISGCNAAIMHRMITATGIADQPISTWPFSMTIYVAGVATPIQGSTQGPATSWPISGPDAYSLEEWYLAAFPRTDVSYNDINAHIDAWSMAAACNIFGLVQQMTWSQVQV
jgi:hypothetical protein